MISTVVGVDFEGDVENLDLKFTYKRKTDSKMVKHLYSNEDMSFLEKTKQLMFIFCYKFLILFYTMIYFYFLPLFILILVFSYGKMP